MTATLETLLTGYVLRSEVPIVFGKAVLAQAAKAGSLNVMFELTAFDARSGSMAKKKEAGLVMRNDRAAD